MSYILGLVAVGVLFLILHNMTELDKKQKTVFIIFLLGLIASMYLYNVYTDYQREKIIDIVLKYKQDKSLTCKGIKVDKTNFSYSVGTQTFIGLKGTPHYGRLISASECQ
jgi:hypothetical protein